MIKLDTNDAKILQSISPSIWLRITENKNIVHIVQEYLTNYSERKIKYIYNTILNLHFVNMTDNT